MEDTNMKIEIKQESLVPEPMIDDNSSIKEELSLLVKKELTVKEELEISAKEVSTGLKDGLTDLTKISSVSTGVDIIIKKELDCNVGGDENVHVVAKSPCESLERGSSLKEKLTDVNVVGITKTAKEAVDVVVKQEPNWSSKVENKPSNLDPYAYLERNGFTSEKFKIEVRGLPKFYGIGELKKLLNQKLKLGSNKIKIPKMGSPWLYVCFRSEEDKDQALKVLNGLKWKNQTLTATAAKPAPDPLVKRRNEATNDDVANKRQKLDDTISQIEVLKDCTVPLWRLTPDQQASKKIENVTRISNKLILDIEKNNKSLKSYFCKQKENNGGSSLKINPIVRSPCINGYRNKCEFTIGKNGVTGEPTVGMRLGAYAAGTVAVAPIYELPHVPDRMKEVVRGFEEYIRSSSFAVFDPETYTGHWRQLTVRWGTKTDQLMVIVGIHPQQMNAEEKESFKQALKDYFILGEGQKLSISSLFFQEITKRQSGQDQVVVELVAGECRITEILCGLRFTISPLSFFQVNTAAAELLYKEVGNLTQLTSETTLVDVCCGTGTIGLSLYENCGQILGLEIDEKAVQDAYRNAEENNITNCEFFSGPAEEILQSVVDRAKFPDVVAVVDPPRAGLRQNAVVMLRRISKIKKIAYLACDFKSATKNIVDLSRPSSKTLHGDPFVPIAITPVDMFPHTEHCEVVIYLQRLSETEV